jgi:hypothetical protein
VLNTWLWLVEVEVVVAQVVQDIKVEVVVAQVVC